MEARAVQRVLVGHRAVALEAGREHGDGVDDVALFELPRGGDLGQLLGVDLDLADGVDSGFFTGSVRKSTRPMAGSSGRLYTPCSLISSQVGMLPSAFAPAS